MIRAFLVQVLLLPLRFYKWALSPLLPPLCRFHPSCSVYAMGAIGVHGPVKGTWLAMRRLSRCHPFHPGGFDPVPPRNGVPAEVVLEQSEPAIVARLKAPHPFPLPVSQGEGDTTK